MEVKKAIKKVVALAAGATMMGATVFSALAADLSQYPAPFVKDGKFDAFIVVGDKAAAEDVVGAVDIGASLQFEMRKETTVSLGTADVLISDGVKIKGTGSEVFNYGENLGEVR
ncbi:MAG: S-layer protein, partial [Candidatus Woesearchaeota archaeon]